MSNEKQFSQGFTPNLPLWSFQLQKDSKLALKTRKDLEIHLITRALKDESFRAELIANPKAIIEQEIGSKLPNELEITVLEQTEDTIYMVLPCNPYEGLSEEELQANLGMSYEDVAQWVLDQQGSTLFSDKKSVEIIVNTWTDNTYKQRFLNGTVTTLEQVIEEEISIKSNNPNVQIYVETFDSIFMVIPKISIPPEIPVESLDMNVLMIASHPTTITGQTQPSSTCTTNGACCGHCVFLSIIFN
ncbi:NHLP leader peptide family RiPP precursor [Dolichospermum lemmermannii CS-548]|uniref:NHLP leader peptide family RiPP precursor n=1 Tax=Dolichospermum lemmermannii TaxID=54295 RepID=UPI00232A9542|nr:NHLP leader peptide family RiPP precursor [Dolichospermum lemmermannii]MDB9436312.1 NHLP leader peptide family RiPP precursor [Dolichospermum lemmermannii CS-548]